MNGNCFCLSGFTGIKCDQKGNNINMRILLVYYHHILLFVFCFEIIYVFIYDYSIGLGWVWIDTGMYCQDYIVLSARNSLDDCKGYCETNGAKRLIHYTDEYCRCCTDSSELKVIPPYEDTRARVYTIEGN